jgi:hypothetical protein
MKKTTIYLMAFLFISLGMNSCKKGENDPFLSLKSRTSRMVGEWEVTKMSTTQSGIWTGVAYTNTTTIEGGSSTTTFSAGGTSTQSTATVSNFNFSILKDGTYSNSLTYDDGSGAVTEADSGSWMFIGKNKNGELKNKEGIIFTTSSSSSTSSGSTSTDTFTGFNNGSILLIDQLKSKEIIIKGEYSENPAGGSVTTTTYEYILTAI